MIRVARSLFQRVLESDPAAARRLRDELANRTSQIASDILMARREAEHLNADFDRILSAIWLNGRCGCHRDVVTHTSSITVTGTWSDGRSQPRASRVMRKSLTPSCSARETQM